MDKPGYQTSEFWLSLAAVVAAYLLSTDFGGDESTWWGKGIAIVAVVLASLGYTASRAIVKKQRIASDKT